MGSVVVIEDEPNISFVLSYALRQAGFEVAGFTDPQEGMAHLLSEAGAAVDLLLVDLWMPGLGGKTIIETLSTTPGRCDIPIILMTGAVPTDADMPVPGTYRKHVAKPFDLDVIVAEAVAITGSDPLRATGAQAGR